MRLGLFLSQSFYLLIFALCFIASPSLTAEKSQEITGSYFSLPILQRWTVLAPVSPDTQTVTI
jgi:hypothetical protein